MEKMHVRAIVVALSLVMGMLVEKSEAQLPQFAVCFGACIVGCIIHPHDFKGCSLGCVKHCILGGHEALSAQTCIFGCAESSCANISTIDNPAVEEVSKCVGSCEQTCVKKT